jgi:ribulose-phosphate 3-epimerase
MIRIVPSILSADLTRLGDQVREAAEAGADRIQVDVMDGHFVPNLTFGPDVVAAVKRCAPGVPVEAHLMVERPERFVSAFAGAGADYVIVQVESTYSLHRTLVAIAEAGCRPAVALNPATPVEALRELVPLVSMILVMTVEPGFGGQPFLDLVLPKLRRARSLVGGRDASIWLQVDGGVSEETIERCAEAGADVFVAGSAVYGSDDPARAVQALRAQAERATAHAAWVQQSQPFLLD